MHKMSIKKLISEGKIQSLGTMLMDLMDELKNVDYDLFEKYDKKSYTCAFGEHISEPLLDSIYSDKIARHWTKEQTTAVGRNIAVDFTKFTECDFNYAMNYLYHTLYNSINTTDANSWGKMAKNWLTYNNPLKHFYYIKTL